MKSGKIWGETSVIFAKNNVSIHRIETKKDAWCSTHKHEHKYNMFFVESGSIEVHVWKNDYDLVDEITLRAGQYTKVAPGEYHQFEANGPTVAFEIYWTQFDSNDIIRETVGSLCAE
jgi:mannose-6-phosphate isomerase-like protein (cupin superfamily)